MPRRCRTVRWLLIPFAFFVSGSSFVHAQKGLEELERELRTKHRAILVDLLRGNVEANPNTPGHVEAISAETEYLTRRFIDPIFTYAPPGAPRTKTMTYLIEQVEIDVRQITRSKNDVRAVAKMYTHYFCQHARKVILSDDRRTPLSSMCLTAALVELASLGQGELGETLAELIEEDLRKDMLTEAERLRDPDKIPNDGMKYYALRGLQTLLAQPPMPAMVPILSKEQELKVVRVLLRLINTTRTFQEGTTTQEIDGFRVRRREAIKALAFVTTPGVPEKMDGAALTLLRVVARDSKLTPVPSIDERLEAAVGLARMKFDRDADYHPDYAAYHIGLFLNEFVTYCNTDNQKYQRPVRVYASRLFEALDSIKIQANDPANKQTAEEKKFALSMVELCQPVLEKLERAPDGRVNPNDVGLDKLKTWVASTRPPNALLFKGVAESTVLPPKKLE